MFIKLIFFWKAI